MSESIVETSLDGFKEEEDRLLVDIQLAQTQSAQRASDTQPQSDLERRFERVAEAPSNSDVGADFPVESSVVAYTARERV